MPTDLSLSIKALRDWAVEHCIEERTVSSFWQCVRGYQDANRDECLRVFGHEGLAESEFTVAVSHISITMAERPYSGFAYVTAIIPIVYGGVDKGTYRAIFSLEGEEEDDYFDIDPFCGC